MIWLGRAGCLWRQRDIFNMSKDVFGACISCLFISYVFWCLWRHTISFNVCCARILYSDVLLNMSEYVWMWLNVSEYVGICLYMSEYVWICLNVSLAPAYYVLSIYVTSFDVFGVILYLCMSLATGYVTWDTHCNTLQHTATHCNTLQHTAIHCNTLQHTATHCNTLQQVGDWICHVRYTLQHAATHCNTLQHTACNALQQGGDLTCHVRYTLQHTGTH